MASALEEKCGMGIGGDIWVETSECRKIPAHSYVLSAASPVLESIILDSQRRKGVSRRTVRILGVPHDAVLAFITILSSTRDVFEEHRRDVMEEYAVQLMVLSHAYRVRWLKWTCEKELASRLTAESVVDTLQLAKQCDAQRLYFQCMKLLHDDFSLVEKTEGWIFLQNNDPSLELEILQFLQEFDTMRKRRRGKIENQRVYLQLSEAMECLQRLCTDGFTKEMIRNASDNNKTCHALQLLIHHIASCRNNRVACPRCRRMWNLIRLHSSICDLSDQCMVPLCKQFKMKMKQTEGKAEDRKWEQLAKKLVAVRVISSLSKRKTHDLLQKPSTGF
ncbi:BTB/POZ and TAZ domain-containing protein 1-like [Iris pallida]|uniref:BTB/POZ and TAZ domain-containing protein 1-like n=1 Tax=Iris pallida TaxID=29817 RepID=A0AAX6FN15_IRIPA|nr:BTB/POZ and TAZ domain-containing protein 1-like [Iris pallida]